VVRWIVVAGAAGADADAVADADVAGPYVAAGPFVYDAVAAA